MIRTSRPKAGPVFAAVLALLALMLGARPAWAGANLLVDPGLESLDGNGFPLCWEQSGWGTGTADYTVTSAGAHGGTHALRLTVTGVTTGDRKAMMRESPSCAPAVTPGHQYDLGVWYTTSTPDTVITAFRHDVATGWQYWTDLSTLPPATAYAHAEVRTPVVPPNTDQLSWGVTVYGTGTVTTDDYTMTDATVPAGPDTCTAGPACTAGSWQVMPFPNPVRSMHAIVLHNGRVLLMAGSGNDPMAFAAGTFTSAVYDPATGGFHQVRTPVDLFCSGHVQLPDGRVLIMGGTRSYPAADGSHGYEGLASGYLFDPATESYTPTNDMNDGHWYPSATEMGDGDVLTFGGLRADSSGSVTAERFATSAQAWQPTGQVNQSWHFWGLYPSMVLLQDGRLFYTGSHVFGNGTPGAGAALYDYRANTVTDVPGLQSKDTRDQSMSVLLPPAQDQRVLTVGGGNIVSNVDAGRQTDLVDLRAASPAYTPGPLLPLGHLADGSTESAAQGKMYVSTVLLPDGRVLETGGALHNRADPVFEASMFDPATDTFTAGLATDPIPRSYHSASFLLPDGRVMTVGDNPGNGSFDLHVSIYTPPYLYHGARPQITSVADPMWSYGSSRRITVDGPIVRAELIRPAAVTHSSDPNQRFVDLPLTVHGDGSVDLNVTSNPNLAPPGYYMLFVVDANGVPSVAQWVHLM
ncbi:hypothetical protein GCM10009665_77420 [Kitasatospora nipponensis]|uniref:Glyoxal oxidase-like protein n=1 Tax=Kitasatospora nipponensis TaxID=258049 RepID=A0ABN1TA55_9ACTN